MRVRTMELNASDERGISVVREKVKQFAMGAVGNVPNAPPFKIIILDEADSLTPDAQAALRRTMETYSKVTRFCIICNYVSRIIEPLASRCSKYRFKPLDKGAMMARLQTVCRGEGVDAGDDTLEAVLRISGGDMRKAITFLQSASQLYGGKVKPEHVVEISGVVPDKSVDSLVTSCKEGTFQGVRRDVQSLLAAGYSVNVVLERLVDAVVRDAGLSNTQKGLICERIAKAEKRLADGADEELQLVDVAEAFLRAAKGIVIPADKERAYF
jgi:replication factor C subunit 2/4